MTRDPRAVLTPLQSVLVREFGALPDSRLFYLAGASALSGFYLGHRRSGDLDLFTAEAPLIRPVSTLFWDKLRASGMRVDVVRSFESFAEAVVKSSEETRVQLAQDSPFRLEPLSLRYEGLSIETFRDLAANKLLALFGRAEARDFVDVFILVRDGHFSMDELIGLAARKDAGLDSYFLAQAFQRAASLPDDLSRLPVEMLVDLDMSSMKKLFESEAQRLLREGLSGRRP